MTKKRTQQNIYHIDEVNFEIDYDKLAEAIIRADKKAREFPIAHQKESFPRMAWHIIWNKKQTQWAYTAYLMAAMLSIVLNIMAILSFLLFVGGLSYLGKSLMSHMLSGIEILSILILLIVFALFSLIFRACANEMSQEKDRDYIVSAFSSIAGFAALVVAIISVVR